MYTTGNMVKHVLYVCVCVCVCVCISFQTGNTYQYVCIFFTQWWFLCFYVSLVYKILLNELALLVEQSISVKKNDHLKIKINWASLVAQWLRICLPMQGTRVRALVRKDPTCCGATGPVSHNYWACASGACALQQERLQQWEARAPRWRVAPARHN